jgi:hypothetical protein
MSARYQHNSRGQKVLYLTGSGVSQAVMSSALAHHEHAGTSEDKLWHTHGGNSHYFSGFKVHLVSSYSPYILRDVMITFRSLSLAVKRTLDFYVHVIPALHLLGLARGINVIDWIGKSLDFMVY